MTTPTTSSCGGWSGSSTGSAPWWRSLSRDGELHDEPLEGVGRGAEALGRAAELARGGQRLLRGRGDLLGGRGRALGQLGELRHGVAVAVGVRGGVAARVGDR